MEVFFREHVSFARWLVLFEIMGLVVTVVWATRFRLLRRTNITPAQLRAEAWRGVLGGVAWLAMLGSVRIILLASFEINAFEAIASCENISPWLAESYTRGRSCVWPPTVIMYALALSAMTNAGLWSGSLAVLLNRKGSRG